MSEERDHIARDTEDDTVTGRRRGRMMRKEEERAEAEERPVYPETPPRVEMRRVKIKKKTEEQGEGETKESQEKE